ncbi:hypothetical protein GCM10011575_27280 [Microlunatus endophyticus]|uniref:Major facilitator superfamily (MFS) profile domain-containing protein n=1 Tax=Microlunatus endophyticus TaxID=1716077 RepID=A0A917W5X2_9ACTN|nr:MFS transporter [Microlunatus endophyticus]GGL67332.1 hypothetical protein GCM10011575_27280 [Microlunatus endophyticus]
MSTSRTTSRIGVVLVPLMLVLFISNLDQTIVATALPSIGRALGSLGAAPWVATSYLVTSAVTTLIFGKLGDTHGRKGVFLIAIGIFLIGSALSAFAPSMGWLIAFRALQGIGGGGLNSLVMAIIGELVPPRDRSKYQAATGIVATVALIGGPLLGGLFADAIGWQWIFLVNLPVGVLAFVITAARVQLARPESSHRVDILGGIVVAVLSSAVILSTSLAGDGILGWGSPWMLALVGVAVVSLIGFLLIERRAAEPILPLGLFRSSIFSISAAQFFIATLVLFVGMLYVPLYVEGVRHLSAFVAGLFLIPELVGLIVATSIAGPMISRTGRYKIYPIIGAILAGVSMAVIGMLIGHASVWLLIIPLFFAGAGIGFFVQVSVLAGQNAVAYRHIGVATGALNFFKSIGGALGSAAFGAILIAAGGAVSTAAFSAVFFWTVPFMAIALVLGIVMDEKPLSAEMVEVAEGKIEVPEY